MKTIIVWYRADLRVHDHPALAKAHEEADRVVPVFIFDTTLLKGKKAGSNRNRFLLECLKDLKQSLKDRGADLVIRQGVAASELLNLSKEVEASAVYYSAEYTPYATKRDAEVEAELHAHDIEARSFGGRLAVSQLQKLRTKSNEPYKVFTPFYKQWLQVSRRELAPTPRALTFPSSVTVGQLPTLNELTNADQLSPDAIPGGETEARKRLHAFLAGPIDNYVENNNDMGKDATSRVSAYLHFGCLSPREIETKLPDSKGAAAWHRQLAWREFYHYILLHFPHPKREFQKRYRATLGWTHDEALLNAWKNGKTGYPAVDAAMRQLKQEGWMHNRARLIVGSFLTKDLGIDWREGETHFMEWLIDGDMANNNGNWQWIASVGVDPAPLFRRLYNPSSQRDKYDPRGEYVRRYVPELSKVPNEHLSEPWKMSEELQHSTGCEIGTDYPEPIVDHASARQAALERYRSVS